MVKISRPQSADWSDMSKLIIFTDEDGEEFAVQAEDVQLVEPEKVKEDFKSFCSISARSTAPWDELTVKGSLRDIVNKVNEVL